MKKNFLPIAGMLMACITIMGLQGCFKDTVTRTRTYTYYLPVYKTTAEVRANIKSNPAQPVERPGKLFIKGNYIFLNDIDKGIHVIDNTNPAHPRQLSFIDIPGNMDLAVKENVLYADLYTDLVAIDISDPQHVVLKKTVENVFPHRYYRGNFIPDSTQVIASWMKRDTTVTEKTSLGEWLNTGRVYMDYAAASSGNGGSAAASPYGTGGSMARFALVNERLYTVGASELNTFNIENGVEPFFVSAKQVGFNIETIYPFLNKLFIGSQNGMFVYNISVPDNPLAAGQFLHVQSCDPVISDGNYAYVTLRTGTVCARGSNELDVLQLKDLSNSALLKTYPLTNPHGLSKDGALLFVCDGNDGLKVYNATDVKNLKLLKSISLENTFDVIARNNVALVIAGDGLYQFSYADVNNIQLLSKINIQK